MSMSPRLATLRQERSRLTRQRLIDAAAELWSANGFDETPVSAVCEAAGVTRTAFFYYFERKEDLLLELTLNSSVAAWETAERLRDTDLSTYAVLRALFDEIGERSERAPKPFLDRALLELQTSMDRWEHVRGNRPGLGQVFTEVLRRGKRRGDVAKKWDLEHVSALLTSLVLQGLRNWVRVGTVPPGEFLRHWCRPALDGILIRPKRSDD